MSDIPFPDQLATFCVFCGRLPEGKTKEHIIPKWLIRLTGDENRVIPLIVHKHGLRPVHQSAASFVFPACDSCNRTYSALETQVSQTLQMLLAQQPVSEAALSALLDWLDKVRIGLWLGDMMRNKDYVVVKRHFHISQRIGQKDRCAFFFIADNPEIGFNYTGVVTPLFHIQPSCFGLRCEYLG